MSGGKKLLIGIIIFTVLACIVKINSHSSSYHYTNYSKPYTSYRSHRTSTSTSTSNSTGGYSGTSSRTTPRATVKPYRSSSSSSRSSKPERTVDPMDHDIEMYYLDYQDEFEDEDDAWDDFEDDPDVWDDY